MTSTLIQPSCVARRRATDPLRAGDALPAEAFAAIRRRLVLEHCKWDPQVEDVSTLTPFPLLMPHAVWADLCASALRATSEAAAQADLMISHPSADGGRLVAVGRAGDDGQDDAGDDRGASDAERHDRARPGGVAEAWLPARRSTTFRSSTGEGTET